MTFSLKLTNKKSLKNIFRLLIFLIIFFSFNCKATVLKIIPDEKNNLEKNIIIKKNQYLEKNVKENFIKLIESTNGVDKIIKYLFYTSDITKVLAYSGKPIELLITLSSNGKIENIKLIKHSEPILLTGIPIEKLLEALSFYKEKNIKNKLNIGDNSTSEINIPIIAGATVTSLILHETILDSAQKIAKIVNIITEEIPQDVTLNNIFKKFTWADLINIGAIKNFMLDTSLNEIKHKKPDELLVDLYFGDIKHVSIGKNLFGEHYYDLLDTLNENESIIIILNKGTWSFKGSGFVRGGIYDRFRLEQNGNIFTFRDSDFQNIYDINLLDLEDYKEYGMFTIKNKKYKPYLTWNLILLIDYQTCQATYIPPKIFCTKNKNSWIESWKNKKFYILLFLTVWITTIIIFITRNFFAKHNVFLSSIYVIILLLDVYLTGILFEAQPSIVNIFSLLDNIKNIETFLFEPYIFIGWMLIISTIFLWGKALFCGWVCPFGALQELIFKIKSLIFNNNNSFEIKLYKHIKYLRYIIGIILLLISFKNLHYAEILAEIEPFKTTWIIGIKNRPLYISTYTICLLAASFYTYRFFCRFICPLGGLLSLLSSFIILKLRRRGTCSVCKICEKNCNSKAINKSGKIDSKECFGCFSCINKMYDKNICPPINNKFLREKYEKGVWW